MSNFVVTKRFLKDHHLVHIRPGAWAGIVIALAAGLAWLTREPFIFPSLGASAYLCATAPRSAAAHPRAVLLSNLVAVAIGFVAIHASGLNSHPPFAVEGMTSLRVATVSMSLALTVAVTSAISTLHPPAGATNLIVTLGILSTVEQISILLASVLLLTCGLVLMRPYVTRQALVPVER